MPNSRGIRDVPRGPLTVAAVGLFPAVAVATRVDNAFVMGVAVLIVALLSSVGMSLVGEKISSRIRFLIELAAAAVLSTVVGLVARVYVPELSDRLGVYLPIIAVNGLVLGEARRGRSTERLGRNTIQTLSTGLAFLGSLVVISLIREVLGNGTITLMAIGGFSGTIRILGLAGHGSRVAGYSVGAFLVLGYLQALVVIWSNRRRRTP